MRQITHVPGNEVVHADDLVPFGQETIAEMGSEKTGGSGNNGDLASLAHGFGIRGYQCYGSENLLPSIPKLGIDYDRQK